MNAKQIIALTIEPDGRERIYKDSLHYGVGNYAYTYLKDAKDAGLTEKKDYFFFRGKAGLFVHLTDSGIVGLLKWLNKFPGLPR